MPRISRRNSATSCFTSSSIPTSPAAPATFTDGRRHRVRHRKDGPPPPPRLSGSVEAEDLGSRPAELGRTQEAGAGGQGPTADACVDPRRRASPRTPAVMEAQAISEKAAKVGFDWAKPEDVRGKIEEELERDRGGDARTRGRAGTRSSRSRDRRPALRGHQPREASSNVDCGDGAPQPRTASSAPASATWRPSLRNRAGARRTQPSTRWKRSGRRPRAARSSRGLKGRKRRP
jgi:hypothetical protein